MMLLHYALAALPLPDTASIALAPTKLKACPTLPSLASAGSTAPDFTELGMKSCFELTVSKINTTVCTPIGGSSTALKADNVNLNLSDPAAPGGGAPASPPDPIAPGGGAPTALFDPTAPGGGAQTSPLDLTGAPTHRSAQKPA